jgi:hypothetical protein
VFCVSHLEQDKQQAAWYDGTSLMEEDHNTAHWGLDKESRGRESSARAPHKDSSEAAELDRIDGMLCVDLPDAKTCIPCIFKTLLS